MKNVTRDLTNALVNMSSPEAGGGCVRRMCSPEAGGGCVRRMHSPEAGGGCVR